MTETIIIGKRVYSLPIEFLEEEPEEQMLIPDSLIKKAKEERKNNPFPLIPIPKILKTTKPILKIVPDQPELDYLDSQLEILEED